MNKMERGKKVKLIRRLVVAPPILPIPSQVNPFPVTIAYWFWDMYVLLCLCCLFL